MINIAKAVLGGVMLFVGLSLDWLSSIGMGLLVGIKMVQFLPADSAPWIPILLIAAMGTVGILPFLIYPDSTYIVIGFLAGGYMLSEFGSEAMIAFLGTGLFGSYWLLFFVVGVIGAVLLAMTKDWGIVLSTALLGAFLVVDLFPYLAQMTSLPIVGGLFIAGSIVQTVMMQFEKSSER